MLFFVFAYFIGAIPFGYLIARAKGVDLFQVGSGNIGATNVGRVLGRKYGILVFVLDFLKGAGPVGLVPVIVRCLPMEYREQGQSIDLLRVATALAAFFGHLFPIYLRFRGGKGVATGAGTVFVLVPGPATISRSRLAGGGSVGPNDLARFAFGCARFVHRAASFVAER